MKLLYTEDKKKPNLYNYYLTLATDNQFKGVSFLFSYSIRYANKRTIILR